MIVYVLLGGYRYEGEHIIGVFYHKIQAEKRLIELGEFNTWEDYYIEEFEVE